MKVHFACPVFHCPSENLPSICNFPFSLGLFVTHLFSKKIMVKYLLSTFGWGKVKNYVAIYEQPLNPFQQTMRKSCNVIIKMNIVVSILWCWNISTQQTWHLTVFLPLSPNTDAGAFFSQTMMINSHNYYIIFMILLFQSSTKTYLFDKQRKGNWSRLLISNSCHWGNTFLPVQGNTRALLQETY